MEDELFALVYRLLREEGNKPSRRGRKQFRDGAILLVYFWAVLHDRPTCWACKLENWPAQWQWLTLPSQPTMSRRLRTLSLVQLLMALMERLRQVHPPELPHPPLVHVMDSRPLVVGGFSKDREARRGYATGGKARGYKSFDLFGTAVVPEACVLGALNWPDVAIGPILLRQTQVQGYVLADATFESAATHAVAQSQGAQLVAPRRRPGLGLGRGPHTAAHLRSIDLLEGPGKFGPQLYRLREQIERRYGNCSSFGGGLQPLPSWGRTPQRVVRWLWAKLILNGLRICIHKGLAA